MVGVTRTRAVIWPGICLEGTNVRLEQEMKKTTHSWSIYQVETAVIEIVYCLQIADLQWEFIEGCHCSIPGMMVVLSLSGDIPMNGNLRKVTFN